MKTAEEILCNWIDIDTFQKLSDVAYDIQMLENASMIKQVAGNYKTKDLLQFPLRLSQDVSMQYETPNGSRYAIEFDTGEKTMSGYFRKIQ